MDGVVPSNEKASEGYSEKDANNMENNEKTIIVIKLSYLLELTYIK